MDTAKLRFQRLPVISLVFRVILIAFLGWAAWLIASDSLDMSVWGRVLGAGLTGGVALWMAWDTGRGISLIPGLIVRVDGARIEVRAPVMAGALVSGSFVPGPRMVLVGGEWLVGRRRRVGYQLRQGDAVARFLGPDYLSAKSVARLRELLAGVNTALVYREIEWPMGPAAVSVDVPATGAAVFTPFAAGGELRYIPVVVDAAPGALASSDSTGGQWSIAVKHDADVRVRIGFDLDPPREARKVARHDFGGATELLILPGVGAAATTFLTLARPAQGLEAWLDATTIGTTRSQRTAQPVLVVSLRAATS